jgi:hypothetical protein
VSARDELLDGLSPEFAFGGHGSIEVGASPLSLAVADGSAWVANYRDATVSRVPI